jgi:SAM-dependent methyltransferase
MAQVPMAACLGHGRHVPQNSLRLEGGRAVRPAEQDRRHVAVHCRGPLLHACVNRGHTNRLVKNVNAGSASLNEPIRGDAMEEGSTSKPFYEELASLGERYSATSEIAHDRVMRYYTGLAEKGVRRVLDVGCGRGEDAIIAQTLGLEVIGLELSESLLKDFRSSVERGTGLMGNVLKLDSNRELEKFRPFDGAFCGFVLIHLTRAQGLRALDQLRGIVEPGGDVFLATSVQEDVSVEVWRHFKQDSRMPQTSYFIWKRDDLRHEFEKRFELLKEDIGNYFGHRDERQAYLHGRKNTSESSRPIAAESSD